MENVTLHLTYFHAIQCILMYPIEYGQEALHSGHHSRLRYRVCPHAIARPFCESLYRLHANPHHRRNLCVMVSLRNAG